MNKGRMFLLLILALALVSCNRDTFSHISTLLERRIQVEFDASGENPFYHESVVLEPLFRGDESEYSFIVTDPNGVLRWEGTVENKAGSTETLLITPGASFPSGQYTIIYKSRDSGEEVETKASLSKIETPYPSIIPSYGLKSTHRVRVTEYDENGNFIKTEERAFDGYMPTKEAKSVLITYTDRYSNRVFVTQRLN